MIYHYNETRYTENTKLYINHYGFTLKGICKCQVALFGYLNIPWFMKIYHAFSA